MTSAVLLFLIFVALNLADSYTTLRILRQGGRELNPFMAWAIKHAGAPQALFTVKAFVLVLVWHFLPLLPVWAMPAYCLFYVAVVANNIRVLQKINASNTHYVENDN